MKMLFNSFSFIVGMLLLTCCNKNDGKILFPIHGLKLLLISIPNPLPLQHPRHRLCRLGRRCNALLHRGYISFILST